MNTEITTQIVSEGAAVNSARPLGEVKPKTPVQKDNIQSVNGERSQKQNLPEDPEKVKALVKDAVDNFEKFVNDIQVDLRYEVDEKTDDIIIKIFEKDTDKLIKQIPAEAILKLKQRINDLLGIIYDETF